MRHQRKGRTLGRSSSHRKAMLRNLASSLFLTERDAEFDENKPKIKGRIVTTLHKAKEVRPLVEKCITIARHSLKHTAAAEEFATDADRGASEWKSWRQSDQWRKWCDAISPAVAARRRALQLLGDKQAVRILFEEIAPRFSDRDGGYTRVLKLATPRLGDAGKRAILEFVGVHDRLVERSEKPSFGEELGGDELEDETISPDENAIGSVEQDDAEASAGPVAAAEQSSEKEAGDDRKSDE